MRTALLNGFSHSHIHDISGPGRARPPFARGVKWLSWAARPAAVPINRTTAAPSYSKAACGEGLSTATAYFCCQRKGHVGACSDAFMCKKI